MKNCIICNKDFEPTNNAQQVCSVECLERHAASKQHQWREQAFKKQSLNAGRRALLQKLTEIAKRNDYIEERCLKLLLNALEKRKIINAQLAIVRNTKCSALQLEQVCIPHVRFTKNPLFSETDKSSRTSGHVGRILHERALRKQKLA